MGTGAGTEDVVRGKVLTGAVRRRREGRQRNGVKNLYGSESIPKSRYKIFWNHENGSASVSFTRLDIFFLCD
jgi:hypothetical protein